ncbi:MAG TPA: VOC family protein [Pyrinomonadaceae bacterium]|jgi:catechol 2,3-dioxygenase-like lactoylglutathione lyase family enzyme
MIKKLSHTTIYVTNQDEALKFYTEKLGFEVRTDATMDGGFRWLTLGLKEQPDLEFALMEPKAGMMMDEETAKQLRAIVEKGVLGAGVFDTDDVHATYQELKGRGVEFMGPPADRPYGIEALFKDNSGNWFSLVQRK